MRKILAVSVSSLRVCFATSTFELYVHITDIDMLLALDMLAQTCAQAGKSAGSCVWSSTNSCYVSGGRCYCDTTCTTYNDCCEDVNASMLSYYGKFRVSYNINNFFCILVNAGAHLSRNRMKQKLRVRMSQCLFVLQM